MTPSWIMGLAWADWLTAVRARKLGRLLAILLGGAVLGSAVLMAQGPHAAKPPALDFDAFWAAARLALAGHPALAYDNAAIEAVERAATEMAPGYLAFYYPPPFLLLCLPLGLMGFVTALLAFLISELALLIALLRRLLPQGWAWLPLLSFPGFLMNALSGQNAPLTASCFAGAALWLDTRPALAGACLGLLVCKPQLAVLVPLALLAARRFRALAACAGTAIGACVASFGLLGGDAWRGFLANAPNARADIETIAIKWPKLQSAFGTIRLFGGGTHLAYGVQALVSAAAVLLLVRAAWRRPGAGQEAAMMVCAALLFTPFLYDYDLAVLCVPMAWLMAEAQRNCWRPFEKITLLALFLLPLAARPLGMGLGVIVGPPLVAGLLVVLSRRTLHTPQTARQSRMQPA